MASVSIANVFEKIIETLFSLGFDKRHEEETVKKTGLPVVWSEREKKENALIMEAVESGALYEPSPRRRGTNMAVTVEREERTPERREKWSDDNPGVRKLRRTSFSYTVLKPLEPSAPGTGILSGRTNRIRIRPIEETDTCRYSGRTKNKNEDVQ